MTITVGVLFGGRSVEHEISVVSALQAIAAFDLNKYNPVPIYVTKDGKFYTGKALLYIENYQNIPLLLKRAEAVYLNADYNDFNLYRSAKGFLQSKVACKLDVLLPIMHGTNGEDGTLQGLLELKGIPFVGNNVLASAVSMDKEIFKHVVKAHDVPVVEPFMTFFEKHWYTKRIEILDKIEQEIGYPAMVKPANLGSTVGVSKVNDRAALESAVDLAASFSNKLLVERAIVDFREINCSVIGDYETAIVSVCEEVLRSGDFLSYNDKYLTSQNGKVDGKFGGSKGGTKGMNSAGMAATKRQVPANLPQEITERIKQLSETVFKSTNSGGVLRVDFIYKETTNELYVVEGNNPPGSLAYYLWEATGKPYAVLLDELVQFAIKRGREQARLSYDYGNHIFKYMIPGKNGSPKMGGKA